MMLSRRSLLLSLASAPLAAMGLSACNSCRPSSAQEVVVYTSVDQVFSEPVFRAFESESGVRVRAVYDTEETKSTGVLNRLIAEAQNPQADVFWSGDPVRPFQLVRRNLVEPYVSPQAAGLPASARAADGTWTGFAARARVLLVNRARVPAGEIRPTNSTHIGSAACAPVRCNASSSSNPTHTPTTTSGVYPTNQASRYPSVVPVFPATVPRRPIAFALAAVPRSTTPLSNEVMT